MNNQLVLDFKNSKSMLTIPAVADSFGVCEASVRNWIKTGHLESVANGRISSKSLEEFNLNHVGVSKLNKRANKLFAGKHNHNNLVEKTIHALDNAEDCNDISTAYESGLSDAHKNKEGIYYTPSNICNSILSHMPMPSSTMAFCDPCCGSGNFIIEAIKSGFKPENVYGFDTDSTAVEITKKRILTETGYETDKVICVDFLEFITQSITPDISFDVIATNPPWGKKLPKDVKTKFGNLLGAGRSLDSSSLFFFASLNVLNANGYLALLLPEAFFNIATFNDARRSLLSFELMKVISYGKPFKGLLTEAHAFIMRKSISPSEQVSCSVNGEEFKRLQTTFINNPFQIINFESNNEDAKVISRIFEKPHVSLKNNARWGMGIVTGNNKKFIKQKNAEYLMPVFSGKEIHKGYADKPKIFMPKDLSMYQQVAPRDLYESERKLMYRFISNELVFYHDRSQTYCLNSVNMLVLKDDFKVDPESLAKYFNSELINWFYIKLFNTCKVLQQNLEKIPIPQEILSGGDFTESDLLTYFGVIKEDNDDYYRIEGKTN